MPKELDSVIQIDNEEYGITAEKVKKGLTIRTVQNGQTTGVTFDGSQSYTIDIPDINSLVYNNNTPTVTALGGISAGTTFDNVSITQMFDKILYPYVKPEIGTTASIPANGGTFENGDSTQITGVTSYVEKKSASISKVELLQGNTVLKIHSDIPNGGNITFTGLSKTIDKNTATKYFTVRVTDSEGKAYTKNTGTFTFVYPYYYGAVSADSVINDETTVKSLTKKVETKGNKAWTFTLNNQKAVFAYPKSYGELRSIINQNNYEVLNTFIRLELSITGLDGTAQSYYVYVSDGASTVSDFKYTFNF